MREEFSRSNPINRLVLMLPVFSIYLCVAAVVYFYVVIEILNLNTGLTRLATVLKQFQDTSVLASAATLMFFLTNAALGFTRIPNLSAIDAERAYSAARSFFLATLYFIASISLTYVARLFESSSEPSNNLRPAAVILETVFQYATNALIAVSLFSALFFLTTGMLVITRIFLNDELHKTSSTKLK